MFRRILLLPGLIVLIRMKYAKLRYAKAQLVHVHAAVLRRANSHTNLAKRDTHATGSLHLEGPRRESLIAKITGTKGGTTLCVGVRWNAAAHQVSRKGFFRLTTALTCCLGSTGVSQGGVNYLGGLAAIGGLLRVLPWLLLQGVRRGKSNSDVTPPSEHLELAVRGGILR